MFELAAEEVTSAFGWEIFSLLIGDCSVRLTEGICICTDQICCHVYLNFNSVCLHTVMSAICRLGHVLMHVGPLNLLTEGLLLLSDCTGVLLVTAVLGYCMWGVACYCSTGLLYVGCCLLL